MTRPATRLVTALAWALDRLDSEEHRYVERYAPCPNGCTFEHRDAGRPGTMPARTAGPADCELCEFGFIEDEDAAHIDPLIGDLRLLLFRLGGHPASPAGQPEHAGDPLILADVLRRFLAETNHATVTEHAAMMYDLSLNGFTVLSADDAATIARAHAARNHPDTQET